MEKCLFHIQLKKLQVLERDYAEEETKGCHLNDGWEDFVEVYAILLSKPFGYDAHLIFRTGGIGHLFESIDPFAR
jgi:hypothetical protein